MGSLCVCIPLQGQFVALSGQSILHLKSVSKKLRKKKNSDSESEF